MKIIESLLKANLMFLIQDSCIKYKTFKEKLESRTNQESHFWNSIFIAYAKKFYKEWFLYSSTKHRYF